MTDSIAPKQSLTDAQLARWKGLLAAIENAHNANLVVHSRKVADGYLLGLLDAGALSETEKSVLQDQLENVYVDAGVRNFPRY